MKLYGKRPDTKDKLWKIWKYALGSYSDDKTAEYDHIITFIRTIIVGVNFITCFFIISGVIRHWT